MIIGRSALVLIITVVIAIAPLVSAGFGISRVEGPAYASVVAAPALQDDNESDDNESSDNESEDNEGDDLFDNEGDDGLDNDFDSDGNILSLNSNAALASDDNDNGFLGGNENSDDNGNSSNDNDLPAVATATGATPTSPTATGSVTACLQPSQQAELTVPEGRVILRNTGPAAVQVTLARIDLATTPLPAQPGARLGGQNGLAFNLGVAACGGAAVPALPAPADLAVQYTDAAVAAGGVNEANLKAAMLQGTTWVPVQSQRNNPGLNEVVAQVTAAGTYSVHNGHP